MEELFNKDLSVINKYYDKEEKKNKYKITHLKGFFSSDDGISINGTQITRSDGLSARILIYDSRNPEYQKPEEFEKDPTNWTLKPDDYIVKGNVYNCITPTEVLERYGSSNVIKIVKVGIKDYGDKELQHFVVTGE